MKLSSCCPGGSDVCRSLFITKETAAGLTGRNTRRKHLVLRAEGKIITKIILLEASHFSRMSQ